MPTFKEQNTLEKRIAESTKIREKFPDKIPIIVEKGNKTDIPDIDKNKFLVPNDLTVGQFSYVIRKRLQLSSETALFIVVNNILPPTSQTLAEVRHCCTGDGVERYFPMDEGRLKTVTVPIPIERMFSVSRHSFVLITGKPVFVTIPD